jgi:hypothetical protein
MKTGIITIASKPAVASNKISQASFLLRPGRGYELVDPIFLLRASRLTGSRVDQFTGSLDISSLARVWNVKSFLSRGFYSPSLT